MGKLVVLGLFGLLAQLIDGTLGMAYGATSTSLLLIAGLAPAIASASVHLAEVGTTLASGVSHWRFGNVDWRLVARLGVPGAVGALLGAAVLSSVSTAAARPITSAILLGIGLFLLIRFARPPRPALPRHRPLPSRLLVPLGLFAGFIDASGGGGWGPVATPSLLLSGRVEPRKAIGSVDTSEFLVTTAASLGFLLALGRQGFSGAVVVALLLGGLVAAPLAAWLVRCVPARLLGASVGGLLVLSNTPILLRSSQVAPNLHPAFYLIILSAWGAALVAASRRHHAEAAPRQAP